MIFPRMSKSIQTSTKTRSPDHRARNGAMVDCIAPHLFRCGSPCAGALRCPSRLFKTSPRAP
ncbi:hypothetical protein [Lysobacter gummosus]|uniref:hypothetical protein n=1 Tax=Lysobacter gummosus TaxID=262324 RepID=UPI00363BF498